MDEGIGFSRSIDDEINRGQDIAARTCSGCHAIGAGGVSPHPNAPNFGSVAARYLLDFLQHTLEGGFDAGHLGMPRIGLAPQELADLKAYLRSLADVSAGARRPERQFRDQHRAAAAVEEAA